MPDPSNAGTRPATVLVVGLGNIGSALVPLLPGMPNLGKVILVDGDRYEEANLGHQQISRRDVGCTKVAVQRQRLRAFAPDLEVETFHARVETVPRGRLHATVIVAGVDSRATRQYLNQLAWRADRPWIDAAVDASELLARVRCHLPPAGDCIECAWDEDAYALLEQSHPCLGVVAPTATGAPAELGALAAGLQAVELRKLLEGDTVELLSDRQAFIDARHHRHRVARYGRNPDCRFDHRTWEVEPLRRSARDTTLDAALNLSGPAPAVALSLEGQEFIERLHCVRCRRRGRRLLRLSGRLTARQRICGCGGQLAPAAFDIRDALVRTALSPGQLDRSLQRLGFEDGDIFSLSGGDGGPRHFELGG